MGFGYQRIGGALRRVGAVADDAMLLLETPTEGCLGTARCEVAIDDVVGAFRRP